MGYSAAKLERAAIRVVLLEMKGWGERSEGMDRMQRGQTEAQCQHHTSVLLVCNRDYSPLARIVVGGKSGCTCKTGATEDEQSH